MKKQAFILVGHPQWGKSETLARFTDDDRHTKHLYFFEEDFYVRRKSNALGDNKLEQFARGLGLRIWENYLIMTLCPAFEEGRRTRIILESLDTVYDLHFFVLRNNFNCDRIVSDEEIEVLKMYGQVEVLEEYLESVDRSHRFTQFIADKMPVPVYA